MAPTLGLLLITPWFRLIWVKIEKSGAPQRAGIHFSMSSNILAEKLLSDAKRFDDLAVTIDILTLEIVQ